MTNNGQHTEEQIKRVMADVLDLNPTSIDAATAMDSTASWTSMNHVNLVVALEQEFEMMFEVAEIESMRSYQDIVQTVETKLKG